MNTLYIEGFVDSSGITRFIEKLIKQSNNRYTAFITTDDLLGRKLATDFYDLNHWKNTTHTAIFPINVGDLVIEITGVCDSPTNKFALDQLTVYRVIDILNGPINTVGQYILVERELHKDKLFGNDLVIERFFKALEPSVTLSITFKHFPLYSGIEFVLPDIPDVITSFDVATNIYRVITEIPTYTNILFDTTNTNINLIYSDGTLVIENSYKDLEVYINGLLQAPNIDYTIQDTNTLSFPINLYPDDIITIRNKEES